MRIFFDTETTGLPRDYRAPLSQLDNWPRLVQIAWLLMDEAGKEVASAEHIIRPDGFVIPPEAARVHGITTEVALERGVPLGPVLDAFERDVRQAAGVVAHNISFDEKIVGAEFVRLGRPCPVHAKPRYCTMRSSTDLCRLPGPYGYKWPTLMELHRHLFGNTFDGAHNALADVRAAARCYLELKRLRLMR